MLPRMLEVQPGDDTLDILLGYDAPSSVLPGISYRLLRRIGQGGSAAAFLAMRRAPEGQCPVVLKVLRPSVVRNLGERAALVEQKEAVSLGRLNDHVPPTPFVVRFIDSGTIPILRAKKRLDLGWIAVEYVHGGPEGTMLTDRVAHSVRTSGSAFEPARAALAVEHVARGLHAVHEVNVIHRDMKPDNVLVCGTGEEEIFKISDFGIARAHGAAQTFGMIVGTPGYAAPELSSLDPKGIGTWSDVFGFACIVYFVLTGEHYFQFGTPMHALTLVKAPERRTLLEAKGLDAELRENADACRAIDLALARATASAPADRTATAVGLCAEILPHLKTESRRPRPSTRRPELYEADPTRTPWTFSLVHRSVPGFFVRDVAWNVDGRCLAATNRGLSFWDGTVWRDAPASGFPSPQAIRFVARTGPGAWLVGGEGGTFARYTTEGVRDLVRGNVSTRFDKYSGDLNDIAVFVGGSRGRQMLFALIGRRWAKPLPIPDIASVHGLARIEDARWLLAGQAADGQCYAATYRPLDREIERIHGANAPAFFAVAGRVESGAGASPGTATESGQGIVVGAKGSRRWWESGKTSFDAVPGGRDLSAAAVDPVGRGWAASAGRIWVRDGAAKERWTAVWDDPSMTVPVISILPDVAVVRAVMADGAVIEGTTISG
jgi:serine/threonine protein kinase